MTSIGAGVVSQQVIQTHIGNNKDLESLATDAFIVNPRADLRQCDIKSDSSATADVFRNELVLACAVSKKAVSSGPYP